MPLPKLFPLSLAFVAIVCGRTSGDDLANAVTTGWKARSEKTPVVHYVINGEKISKQSGSILLGDQTSEQTPKGDIKSTFTREFRGSPDADAYFVKTDEPLFNIDLERFTRSYQICSMTADTTTTFSPASKNEKLGDSPITIEYTVECQRGEEKVSGTVCLIVLARK